MLQGPVAEAIERAMHAEGLLLDIRNLVLLRLNRDAHWLNRISPVGPTQSPVTVQIQGQP